MIKNHNSLKSKSGAKSHGIQKRTLNLRCKLKSNYRLIARLCLGLCHRTLFDLALFPLVGQLHDLGTMCHGLHLGLASFGSTPRGCP